MASSSDIQAQIDSLNDKLDAISRAGNSLGTAGERSNAISQLAKLKPQLAAAQKAEAQEQQQEQQQEQPRQQEQQQEQPRQQEQQQTAPLSQASSSSSNSQFPTINQAAIDKQFRYGKDRSNSLNIGNSDIRDQIYNAGWQQKSDAVRVLTGAGNYGIVSAPSGMGNTAYTTTSGHGATDQDFINAANAAGIENPSQYQKSAGGGLGSMYSKVLDTNKIFNLLQEKGKDLYAVTNAVEGAKRGDAALHATITYKPDGSGNLVPVTNDQGQIDAKYFNAVNYKNKPGFFEEYGPFLMLLPAAGGVLRSAGYLGSLGGASSSAGLTAGEVAANTGVNYFPGVEAGAGHIMAGYTGAPLNSLSVSAGLGGAGYFGADTMDNIIANAIADTYNPNAPKYEVGPEGPAKIGTQQFPINKSIGSTSILDDLKSGYKAYKTASQVGGAVNQILGNNPEQGLGGIDPTTGLQSALSNLAAGKQLGALPTENPGLVLPGAPVGENTALQPMQLQQLSPELGAVDPRLLAQLNKNRQPTDGMQQGNSYYTYGAMPAMQDTGGYTGNAGALLAGRTAGQYDPLGSAGLRQISGYKDGGQVMSPDLLDILEEWGAGQDLKTQTREQIENLSPVDLETLRLAFKLDKHDKYKTGKFPSGQDSVINPTRFHDQPIEDMPGDFKYNRLETDIGNIIRDNPYKPNEMDSMTKDWDGLGTQRQEAMQKRYYAKGGKTHVPEFITGKTGFYVEGKGDGQSDSIPAMLADGEYVFDADTVAALGNGSNKAGALTLDKMRQSIRKHKRSASHKNIPPKAKSPLEYLKG